MPIIFTSKGIQSQWGSQQNIDKYQYVSTTYTPYTPNTTNCILWLDANGNSNFTFSSGSVISTWKDKSGKGNDMTQSTVGSQPILDASGLNAVLAVNTSSSRFLQNTTMVLPTTYSIFAVAYTTTTNSYSRLLCGITDSVVFFGAFNGNNADFTGNGTSWNDVTANSPSTSVTSWGIKGMTNTGTNLLPYLNGTAQTAKVGTNVSITGLLLGTTFYINNQYWNGYIAEVLIYNSVLSDADRFKVEGYLAWKWGLQTSLPVSHTYKSAAPLAVVAYRYYKFEIVSIVDTSLLIVQFDELLIGYNGTKLDYTGAIATSPNPTASPGEEPQKGIDGLVSTKWCATFTSANNPSFIVDFQTSKLVNCFTYITGNDGAGRDPKSFIFYGSTDGTTWVTLNIQTNYATNTTRNYQLPWIAF